jgi:hypothetical protein
MPSQNSLFTGGCAGMPPAWLVPGATRLRSRGLAPERRVNHVGMATGRA